jgi:hypothetical protein
LGSRLSLGRGIGQSVHMKRSLIPHPTTPALAGRRIDVEVEARDPAHLRLVYRLYGPLPALPEPQTPVRTDELWKTTCFELFVRPHGREGYTEFNFSPSSQWASYAFDGYRQGMREQPLATAPTISGVTAVDGPGYGIQVALDLTGVATLPLTAAITAVIEERDGSKSYWSIAHPAAKPDFHDPACFVLELPAPPTP